MRLPVISLLQAMTDAIALPEEYGKCPYINFPLCHPRVLFTLSSPKAFIGDMVLPAGKYARIIHLPCQGTHEINTGSVPTLLSRINRVVKFAHPVGSFIVFLLQTMGIFSDIEYRTVEQIQ